jgi:tRNA pseudouridine55 synthase
MTVPDGVLLVDKPAGPTSFGVVARIRGALPGRPRVGHAGTLDPFATGLLLVLVGRATRLASFLTALDKRYSTTLVLGATSDSGDRDGEIVPSGLPVPSAAEIRDAAAAFVGEIDQVPPAASAVKVGGRRAYALHREGVEVTLTPRHVRIDTLEVMGVEGDRVELDVRCSKGTYIRALARDLGEALGCGAYCDALRRTAIGAFSVDDAASPDVIIEDPAEGSWFRSPSLALGHLPARELTEEERREVLHGRPLVLAGEEGPTRCLAGERLLCVAEPRAGRLRPTVVLGNPS